MRTLAIGDIHGCGTAFNALLATVAPTQDDLVVALGDFVDWGPDSKGVLDRLLKLGRQTHLVGLHGNHEEMMLRSRENADERAIWLKVGGDATLRSYRNEPIPNEHWGFIEHDCRDVYEDDSHIFAHGGLNPDLPVDQQPAYMLRWKTFRDVRPHCSGKIVVCGHTTQRGGRPRSIGHAICIDTGASCGGWLTCFEPATGDYWQANERGESRRGSVLVSERG
jgi:serine/threonine protein phosphatase 1